MFPEAYYSPFTRSMNKGETNAAGAVVLSWADTLAGYKNPSDNEHLAMHEWTHALWIAFKRNHGLDNRLLMNHQYWESLIKRPGIKEKWRQAGYLREYAFTNDMELLACAMECFFETPEQLAKIHPEIYFSLARLLNQYHENIEIKSPLLRKGFRLKAYHW